ncbi:hypothetical protein KXS11_11280 [Plantibacter flavus]|uniref:hypothetical protein n=1 Tax=Plantibacter flavus TaxID=150123 RepID=UPI003F156337
MTAAQQPEHDPAKQDQAKQDASGQWTVEESGDSPFGWFVGAGVGLLAAVLCFTPIWDEVAGRGTGRRAGFTALLAGIGPFGVAAIAVVIAVVFVLLGLRARRRARR